MHTHGFTRWEHYMSIENTFELEIWANPSSYRDGWPSNYTTSWKILLQLIPKLLFYKPSIISYIISSLLAPSWTFPKAYKLQSASNVQLPTKEIFIWHWAWHLSIVFSSVICSIYYVWILTQNVLLLTLSSQSKPIFEVNHHLFHIISLSHPKLFKTISNPSYHFTLTSTIDSSVYDNDNTSATCIYSAHP